MLAATPDWYDTWYGWLAMLAAAACLAAVGVAALWYRRGSRLEALVAERTAELERRTAEAEYADAASGTLLRTVSHDLRTPLNNVFGALEIAEAQAHRPADVVRWISVARAAGVRLRLMLDDLIAHARETAGTSGPVEIAEVPVEATLAEALDEVRQLALAKDRTIELVLAPEVDCVAADAELLRHAVVGLVTNALAHTPDGPVRTTAEPGPGGVRFAVRDPGLVLSDAERAALAAPYRAGDPLPSVGPDLALTVTRAHLRRLSAELEIREGDDGCVASFTLPMFPGHNQ